MKKFLKFMIIGLSTIFLLIGCDGSNNPDINNTTNTTNITIDKLTLESIELK